MAVDSEALGRAIRDLRKRNHMTQEELGEAVGYHTSAAVSISRLETGKARLDDARMATLADALKVTIKELERTAAHPDRETQRLNERPRDREQRILREVTVRKKELDEATAAFASAYKRASEHFLVELDELVDGLEASSPDSSPSVSPLDTEIPSQRAADQPPMEFRAAAVGGMAATSSLAFRNAGTFSRGAAGLGVAGIGAVAIGVLAETAFSLIEASRKRLEERRRMLDEIEGQLAASKDSTAALVTRLPQATELLEYIAVHAGHALERWQQVASASEPTRMQHGSEADERLRDFVLIAQAAFAIRNEFDSLSSARPGEELRQKVQDIDALLTLANEVVTSRV